MKSGKYRLPLAIAIALALVFLITFLVTPAVTDYVAARKMNRQMNLGGKYLQGGSYELALDVFNQVIGVDSANIEALFGKAKSLIGLNRLLEADICLNEIIGLDAENPEAYLLLAQVKVKRSFILEALAVISQGEKRVGKASASLSALSHELESQICIRADYEEQTIGEEIRVGLYYKELLLSPQWSKNTNRAELKEKADGSCVVIGYSPVEVKVTAVYGTLSWVYDLTFLPVDWTKKAEEIFPSLWTKDVEEFLNVFGSPRVIPPFSTPNDLMDSDIIVTTFYYMWQVSDWELEIIPAEILQRGARKIFGPNLRELTPESIWKFEWNPETQLYIASPSGEPYAYHTCVLDISETGNQYIVDVVHIKAAGSEGSIPKFYDEDGNYLGQFRDLDIFDGYPFSKETVAEFPKRRYIFTKLEDGTFYMTQSIKIQ